MSTPPEPDPPPETAPNYGPPPRPEVAPSVGLKVLLAGIAIAIGSFGTCTVLIGQSATTAAGARIGIVGLLAGLAIALIGFVWWLVEWIRRRM